MIANRPFKTLDAKPLPHQLVKPSELVEVVEMHPLSLQDRRIFNELVCNAWDSITDDKTHVIPKISLRGKHDVNFRVDASVRRLMATLVEVRTTSPRGKPAVLCFPLLAQHTREVEADGLLYYSFPKPMREMLKDSLLFSVLERQVMYALSSRYALALYELVQRRRGLDHVHSEIFELDHFRRLLGVHDGKLMEFKNLNLRAIAPAVLEVNGLSNVGCKIEPVLTGRKVTGVRLIWWRKTVEELKAAYAEVRRPKVGRRARLSGEVTSRLVD